MEKIRDIFKTLPLSFIIVMKTLLLSCPSLKYLSLYNAKALLKSLSSISKPSYQGRTKYKPLIMKSVLLSAS